MGRAEKEVLRCLLACWGTEAKDSDITEECYNAGLSDVETHNVKGAYYAATTDISRAINEIIDNL